MPKEKYKEAIILGKIVRKLRDARGLTQEQLAHSADLHRAYISTLELGYRNITLVIIVKIAKALGVDPKDLLEGQ
jgi:transcriptional regulator with XRE-family HTH domain